MDLEMDLEHAMIQKMKMNASNGMDMVANGMDMVANGMDMVANAQAVAVWRWALRGIVIQNQ